MPYIELNFHYLPQHLKIQASASELLVFELSASEVSIDTLTFIAFTILNTGLFCIKT